MKTTKQQVKEHIISKRAGVYGLPVFGHICEIKGCTFELKRYDPTIYFNDGEREHIIGEASGKNEFIIFIYDYLRAIFTDELREKLINYAGNVISSTEIEDFLNLKSNQKIEGILKEFDTDFNEAECDREGETLEQAMRMGTIIDSAVESLMKLR